MHGFDVLLGDAGEGIVDSGAPLPPPLPIETIIKDMRNAGGIAYDESKGRPTAFAGTLRLLTREIDNGYIYGHPIPNVWNIHHDSDGKASSVAAVDPAEVWSSPQRTAKDGRPYGPVVGNPSQPDFTGMRVDAAGNMFWLPQEAPDWLLESMRKAANDTQQALDRAVNDGFKQFQAEENKKRSDEAAAQAAQDAANALAEDQAAEDAAKAEADAAASTISTQQQIAQIHQQSVQQLQDKQTQPRQSQPTLNYAPLMVETEPEVQVDEVESQEDEAPEVEEVDMPDESNDEEMSGLDLLGADDALANQYIVVRIKHIDSAKLAAAIGGSKGQLASSALTIVNTAPKAILDAAIPIGLSQAKNYGIDAEVTTSNVPPKMQVRALSEFWPGLLVGTVVGGFSLAIWKLISKLVNPASATLGR